VEVQGRSWEREEEVRDEQRGGKEEEGLKQRGEGQWEEGG